MSDYPMTILRMTDAEICTKVRGDHGMPSTLAQAALGDLVGELKRLRAFAAESERSAKNGDRGDLIGYVEDALCP